MSVTSINSTQAWRLSLTGEATVDTNTGEVSLTPANFAPGSGTPLDGLTVAEGPVDLSGASSVTLPAASPLNTYPLQVFVNTIVSATGRVAYVVVPAGGDGTIVDISGICDATPTVGSAVFTPTVINSGIETPVDDGVLTFTTGDSVPTAITVTPDPETAAVFAGSVVYFVTSGANTAAGTCMITLTVRRAAP